MEDSRKRNMERRRETSRFAARDRRAKESDIYDDLKDVVPVVEEPTVTHVDRIALLRVAATVCRFRKNAGTAMAMAPLSSDLLRKSIQREKQGYSPWCEDSLAECLDGFILIVDSDGVILYVTESVSIFLGLTQTDFAGRHIKDFINSDDYKELMQSTQKIVADKSFDDAQQCVMRVKSVISPRGRNLNLKSALFKPVSFTLRVLPSQAGHCTLLQGVSVPAGQGTVSSTANAMTKNGETPSGTFMTRHTCDMRISYVSDALNGLLKADSRSLMGASYYDLVHPADADRLRKCIRELLEKGHTRTPYYRLITASGSLAWILTEATTISHTTRGQKGQYIICIHHLLGQQTEAEFDRGLADGSAAGHIVRVKEEPEDREYLCRQPEVMECLDFCPLTGDGEYTPVQPSSVRRGAVLSSSSSHPPSSSSSGASRPLAPSVTASSNSDSIAPPTRKKSYEEVLQWLFRDQPDCPPPDREWRTDCGAARHAQLQTGDSPHAAPAHAASSYGRAMGGFGGGGGGYLLPSPPSMQYGQQHQTPSPQHALSSSFSRCELSSPSSAARPSSPLTASPLDRSLRAVDLHSSSADPRLGSCIPSTDSLALPNSDERRGGSMLRRESFRGGVGQDLLASLSSSHFPSAPAYGGSLSQSQSGTLAKYTSPLDAPPPSAAVSDADSSDLYNAPFVDPGLDMQPIMDGMTKDLASFLDFTPWGAESDPPLPNLAAGEDPLDFQIRDSPPAKRGMDSQMSLSSSGLDDWPGWLNGPSFLDGSRC